MLEELCGKMGITDPEEVQEFALFLIKGEGELVRPLKPHEYLNNVAVDLDVSLHSRRLSWETRLHFDNPTYISTHYSQVSHGPWLLRPWRLGASSHYLGGHLQASLPGRKAWALGHSCPHCSALRCSETTCRGSCWLAPRQMPKLPGWLPCSTSAGPRRSPPQSE